MQAALMYGPNDIRVEEIEKPECPEGGFVLRVMAVGLCGSDIRNLTTDSKSGKYPHIYGHEITGIIDEISPSCTEYKVGDRCIFILLIIVCNVNHVEPAIVKCVKILEII